MSIVTLPCEIGQHRAVSFDIIEVCSDRVFLVDLCANWNGYARVADAAREVFQHCTNTFGPKRVVCEDAREGWQEIVPKKGAFDISPYKDNIPFKVEIKSMFAGGRSGLPVGSF